MQESQFLPQHQHQHQHQIQHQHTQHPHPQSSPNVLRANSKTIPTEESQLCDDILSCILALDEVIAEFDDSHSISSPLEPPASTSASVISSSPPVPIVLSSSSSSQANNHSLRLETSTSSITQGVPSVSPVSSPSRSVRFPEFHTSTIGSIKLSQSKSKPDALMMTSSSTPSTPSQCESELRRENCFLNTSVEIRRSFKDECQEQGSRRVKQDIFKVGDCKKENNSNGSARKKSKIPSLKSPSKALPIISSGQSNNGASGGGGSFPKVKLRSSNPLLEYRSVKMQNFILPDELPPELIKENWDFPAGKNLPRSLSKTRETCIVDDDGHSPKAINPRFIPTKSEARASRIPKLRLDMCNIYEDNNFNLSQNLNEKVTSPGSSSVGGQSPRMIETVDNSSGGSAGSGSGCSYDFSTSGSNSNIPVPKPRRNSPVVQSQSNSFASVTQSGSSPKGSEPTLNSTTRINKAVSPSQQTVPAPVQIKDASNSRNHGSRDNSFSENQFHESFRSKSSSNVPHTHDTDDGYLSMINKTEDSPVLWPEEMIENEIFSDEELRRLSFHCEDRFLSSRSRDLYRTGKNHSDIGAEKTDYFSDDSLEYENTGEDESFPSIPSVKAHNLGKSNQTSSKVCFSANADFIRGVMRPSSELSESRENHSVTLISIPGGDDDDSSSSANTSPVPVSPAPVIVRKPCSFFVPMENECKDDNPHAQRRKKKSTHTPNHGDHVQLESSLHKGNLSLDETEAKQEPPFQSVQTSAHEHETQVQNGYLSRTNDVVRDAGKLLEPAKMILEKIENFAEKLALKIERSGSEEAAATLTLQKVEIDIENNYQSTPHENTITHSLEYCPSAPSSIITPENQPVLVTVNNNIIQQSTRTQISSDIMEFLSENSDSAPITQHDLSDEQKELLHSSDSETLPSKKTVLGNLTSDTDQRLVDWRLANGGNQDGTGNTEPVNTNTSGDLPDPYPGENAAIWSVKLEDDSASDDLSETPPQFIPEPPPVQLTESNSPAANNVSPPNQINQISQKLAANIPPQALQNGKDLEGWKASSDRNSRSSEDIIQAVNSETLPEASRSRAGASTLPLNMRPPADGRGSFRPIRNILNRFRKSKPKRSNMSLSEERTATLNSSTHGSRPQQLNEEDSEGADNTSDANRANTSTKRRSSSVSSTKKSNIFVRIFSRKNK